jgi:hypothetical protein
LAFDDTILVKRPPALVGDIFGSATSWDGRVDQLARNPSLTANTIAVLTAADLDLRDRFERKTLPTATFGHQNHVRLTWVYLTEHSAEVVAEQLCRSLLELATSLGAPERFHYTLTVAWVHIIEAARQQRPDLPFDDLVIVFPQLLDKRTPLEYYTSAHLDSDEAYVRWVSPDRRPFEVAPQIMDIPSELESNRHTETSPPPIRNTICAD